MTALPVEKVNAVQLLPAELSPRGRDSAELLKAIRTWANSDAHEEEIAVPFDDADNLDRRVLNLLLNNFLARIQTLEKKGQIRRSRKQRLRNVGKAQLDPGGSRRIPKKRKS